MAFPVHTDDAHVHFRPLTDWRFHSPVSYWQRQNRGGIVGTFETILGLCLAILLWKRLRSWRIHVAAAACVVPYFISLGLLF